MIVVYTNILAMLVVESVYICVVLDVVYIYFLPIFVWLTRGALFSAAKKRKEKILYLFCNL